MKNTNAPKAYMLVGVPGSGKSTWAKHFEFPLVSSDAYIEQIATSLGSTYGAVFKATIGEATKFMESQLQQLMKSQQSLIWDQTNLNMKSRRAKLNMLLDAGYEVTAVAFEIPQAELTRRRVTREQATGKSIPVGILESMSKTYQRPTRLEGFAKVIIVTADGEKEGA